MPWMETRVVDERARFVLDVVDRGVPVAGACRAYGVSRKTGHKWLRRFRSDGVNELGDRSRAPKNRPGAVSEKIQELIVASRRKHPTWGPRKLRAWLERQHPGMELPVPSTIGELLKRQGLVRPRRRSRRLRGGDAPGAIEPRPNSVWCVDFKGEFRLGNGRYCYPLTITDGYSRYLLACRAFSGTSTGPVKIAFGHVFNQYGVPEAIRSDNGTPFASPGVGRLSCLSVWWLKLGIRLERIAPGHPEQNGRHERMHRTLKAETARQPSGNHKAQQRRFDAFRREYNHDRPHEALANQVPAEVYRRSIRKPRERRMSYPSHWERRQIGSNGMMCWQGERLYVSRALTGEIIGLVEREADRWLVHFGPLVIGILETDRRAPRVRSIPDDRVVRP